MAVAKYLQSPSQLLIAAAVLVPTSLFSAAAWFDYHATQSRAEEYVITTTNALAEQMQAALQTADMVLARTLDYVEGMDWQTIGTSHDVHEYLAKIDRDLSFVQSVFLVDPEGRNSASSRAFPMQPFDVRDREYYIHAKAGDNTPYITPTFSGKMTGEPGFTVSLPRVTNGHFDGVVAVTLSPSYFQRFYEQIAPPAKNASAALVRTDGKRLMRYPAINSIPGEIPGSSPLLRAAASGAASGIFVGSSSIDGVTKLAAFRKVEGQPLLANFALAQSYYLRAWYIDLMWMGSFALLTTAALIWASMLVLRHAGTETAQLRQLLDESERRKAAEQAVQHLQKMEALGRLSGGVAHDFNNLLTAIIGALELAAKHTNEPERLTRLINMATSAAERGARLTSQMLAFSRNHDITPHPLDINSIIKEADTLLQRTVESLIEISYTLEEDLWPATADRTQLEVALLNLAANARDAMPLGGKLIFMTRNVTATGTDPGGLPAGDYVKISVADTGQGMTAETAARAFDPFFTTKPVGKGTGLGLSQVHGFATQLGGTVKLDSEVGKGTTVAIWLPRARTAIAEIAASAIKEITRIKSLNVLLVDDDQAVRTLVAEMLGDLGHRVATAENGPEAINLLSTDAEFDLLVVDFAMPLMNGAQVAAEALKLRPMLRLLFVTGYADSEILKHWTDLGYGTLNKPFSARDLDLAIRNTIRSQPRSNNVIRLPSAKA